ncbi:MAG: hypothetical protein ACRCX7_12510, partial [Cetobacterium sp.]|uniref:hypothetical protein n=1 Tax=Cetobacterium sp. TaxID=2071632 RepID=UPI003F37E0CA
IPNETNKFIKTLSPLANGQKNFLRLLDLLVLKFKKLKNSLRRFRINQAPQMDFEKVNFL